MLLHDPLVQVLTLEVGELSGKESAIAFELSAMAPYFSRTPPTSDMNSRRFSSSNCIRSLTSRKHTAQIELAGISHGQWNVFNRS